MLAFRDAVADELEGKEDCLMNYRNPVYNENGTIDVEIEHPDFGWISFTASPDDSEQHGRQIFDDLKDEAAPYTPPEGESDGSPN